MYANLNPVYRMISITKTDFRVFKLKENPPGMVTGEKDVPLQLTFDDLIM